MTSTDPSAPPLEAFLDLGPLRQAFNECDLQQSGYIQYAQIFLCLEKLRLRFDRKELWGILKELFLAEEDVGGKDVNIQALRAIKVDFEQFCEIVARIDSRKRFENRASSVAAAHPLFSARNRPRTGSRQTTAHSIATPTEIVERQQHSSSSAAQRGARRVAKHHTAPITSYIEATGVQQIARPSAPPLSSLAGAANVGLEHGSSSQHRPAKEKPRSKKSKLSEMGKPKHPTQPGNPDSYFTVKGPSKPEVEVKDIYKTQVVRVKAPASSSDSREESSSSDEEAARPSRGTRRVLFNPDVAIHKPGLVPPDRQTRHGEATVEPRRSSLRHNKVEPPGTESDGKPKKLGREDGKPAPNRRRSSIQHAQIFSKFPQLQSSRIKRQLGYMQVHRARFVIFFAFVQLVVLIWSIVYNGRIENIGSNPFIGASKNTLLRLGARSVICMRRQVPVPDEITSCPIPLGVQTEVDYCALYEAIAQVCGMSGFVNQLTPDQWWRWITSIFLTSGALHYAFNAALLFRIGIWVERTIGSLSIGAIMILSGLGGNVLGSLIYPQQVSTASSAAIFGIFGILFVDIFQNWPLLSTPKRDFFILLIQVLIAFGFGLLPWIDNWSHIGGFLVGLLTSFALKPILYITRRQYAFQLFLKIAGIPATILLAAGGFYYLYAVWDGVTPTCDICRHLECVPQGDPWCAIGRE